MMGWPSSPSQQSSSTQRQPLNRIWKNESLLNRTKNYTYWFIIFLCLISSIHSIDFYLASYDYTTMNHTITDYNKSWVTVKVQHCKIKLNAGQWIVSQSVDQQQSFLPFTVLTLRKKLKPKKDIMNTKKEKRKLYRYW